MTILNELNASGGTAAKYHTFELECDTWDQSYTVYNGYVSISIITEDLRVLNAIGTGMDVALPRVDSSASQRIRFVMDNMRGEVVRLMRESRSAQEEIRVTYRLYLSDNLTAPADNPVHLIVRSFSAKGSAVDITAGYFDLIDMQVPRDVYDEEFAPGLQSFD